MDRVVPHFQEELEALQSRLLEMGGLAEERVRACIEALESRDLTMVAQVMGGERQLVEPPHGHLVGRGHPRGRAGRAQGQAAGAASGLTSGPGGCPT